MVERAQRQQLIAMIRERSTHISPRSTDISPHLTPHSHLRCIAFDVYGTLFRSATGDIGTADTQNPQRTAAFHEAVSLLPHTPICPLSVQPDDLTRQFDSEVNRIHREQRNTVNTRPEINVREVWRAALCRFSITPGNHAITVAALWNRHQHAWVMHSAIRSYELGAAKPGAPPFVALLKALARDGIAPNEVLYVGNNMASDLMAAARQGLETALFAGDARSLRLRRGDPRTKSCSPDSIITDLSQLTSIITDTAVTIAKGTHV